MTTDTGAWDVVVIGMGAAGVAAALTAKQAGKKVLIVARSPGATALSSGAVDGAGGQAAEFMATSFPSLHLGMALFLPTVYGNWKSTSMSLASQAGASPAPARPGEVVVVRFSDVEDTAGNVGSLVGRGAGNPQFSFRDVSIPLLGGGRKAGVFEAAGAVDMDTGIARAAGERLRAAITPGKTVMALIPPVMGIRLYSEAIAAFSMSAGLPVFEMLAGVPSVPGQRWQAALEDAVARALVEVQNDDVVRFTGEGDRVMSVGTASGAELRAASFVLATGKFIGGGVHSGDGFSEPLFGLQVHCGKAGPTVFVGDLAGSRICDSHQAMSAGLRTDDRLRPVDGFGRATYTNLFAAGAVLEERHASYGIHGIGNSVNEGIDAGRFASM
ncbi:MAG: FAD-binding protein [Myxococcota bacterium]|jgi:anaerobic glycerol-3-phosphate dehydrogenase